MGVNYLMESNGVVVEFINWLCLVIGSMCLFFFFFFFFFFFLLEQIP